MTEQTNAELIAEARGIDFVWVLDNSPDDSVETIQELADALEAADQRAAELAAVVEKVRAWAGSHSGSAVSIIRSLLATAPADALREHDEALIEKLADKAQHQNRMLHPWLREEARQRREERA